MEKKIEINIDYSKIKVFEEFNVDNIKYPIVLSVPHSGLDMPEEFLKNSILSKTELRTSEDPFVDELVLPASNDGIPMIKMNISRAFIDVNRDKMEIDESMYFDYPENKDWVGSRRCRVGLGVIPRVVSGNMPIYDGLISYEDAKARIANIYDAYHNRLNQLVDKVHKKFGYCLLVDCHSMPSKICTIMNEDKPVDYCVSTLFDQSCPEEWFSNIGNYLAANNRVEYNRPYSGGFITFDYCQPRKNVYTLQIELNRSVYMNEETYAKTAEFEAIKDELSTGLKKLGTFLLDFKPKL